MTAGNLDRAHATMQRHLPGADDPEFCGACVVVVYPCHQRLLARELLIDAGHLVPDMRPPRPAVVAS